MKTGTSNLRKPVLHRVFSSVKSVMSRVRAGREQSLSGIQCNQQTSGNLVENNFVVARYCGLFSVIPQQYFIAIPMSSFTSIDQSKQMDRLQCLRGDSLRVATRICSSRMGQREKNQVQDIKKTFHVVKFEAVLKVVTRPLRSETRSSLTFW